MTNEWEEFKAYTTPVQYVSARKSDKTYMGRFTLEMILDFYGFSRIFNILARGYLFHDADGNLLKGDPYDRIDRARNAVLAWCSMPDRSQNPKNKVDYRELSADYPELVDEQGKGWYYRHIKSVVNFGWENFDQLNKSLQNKLPGLDAGFAKEWKKKVGQLQVPIFARNTKGAWTVRIDDVLSAALEEGPLRTEEYVLPKETKQKLAALDIPDRLRRYAEDMTAFYYANKQDDCEYVVFPVANFNAYYGSTTFSKKKLPLLPQSVFEREERHGLCRLKVKL